MVHMTSGILYIMRKRLVALCARGAYLECTTIASSLPRLHVFHNICHQHVLVSDRRAHQILVVCGSLLTTLGEFVHLRVSVFNTEKVSIALFCKIGWRISASREIGQQLWRCRWRWM